MASVEFEPVQFLVLDRAGPRPLWTSLGSFLNRRRTVYGVFPEISSSVGEVYYVAFLIGFELFDVELS